MKNRLSFRWFIPVILILFIGILYAFTWKQSPSTIVNENADVATNNYWDQGDAEISRYSLSQNRYKEYHPGEVVMIFVKEDFLTKKQVKNETYTDENSTPVLKNIQSKKFTTGIYDYHLSTNTFTAFDQQAFPGSIKVQHVSSEWCGTSYVQLNHKKDVYEVGLRSYFEQEGDQNFNIKDHLLEDEIFNLIRLNPEILSDRTYEVIPSMEYSRLMHKPIAQMSAEIKTSIVENDEFAQGAMRCEITFSEANRVKTIYYKNEHPHTILGWDDSFPSIGDGRMRTTKARLTHSVREPYWQFNAANDVSKRQSLGLSNY